MPKRLARTGIQSEKVPVSIRGEDKTRIRGQHSSSRTARAKFMCPPKLAGLVIDSFQHAFAPQPIIRARPAVGTIRRLIEVEAIGGVRTDNKQAGFGIEAGRTVVSESPSSGAIRRPSGAGSLAGSGIGRPSLSTPDVQFTGPKGTVSRLLPLVRSSTKKYPLRELHEHLSRLSMKSSVHQHWDLDRVPVMRVMR